MVGSLREPMGGDSGGLVAPWQVMWGRMPCAKVGLKAQESGR